MGGSTSTAMDPEMVRDIVATPMSSVGLSASRIRKGHISADYIFTNKVVGVGFSGPVRLAVSKVTKKEYAVKTYDKKASDPERIEFLKGEALIYQLLDHPNICKLFAIYENERYVWMVMEYCAGQELFQRLHSRKSYKEQDAAEVTWQMCAAVHYLHSHNVVHRDLKMENWVYESNSGDGGRLKLIDFGFSKVWNPHTSQKMHHACGSLTYASPDTLGGSYTNSCDMWSLGVIVYFLLVGVPPFFGSKESILVNRICKAEYSMSGQKWAVVSDQAKDFVRRLLQADPTVRMTAQEALEHPWLKNRVADAVSDTKVQLGSEVLRSMRQFAISSQLKRAALAMMAYCLTTKEIEEVATLFHKFDRNRDGSIQMSDFMEVMRSNFNISNTEIEKLFHAMATSNEELDALQTEVCYSDFVAALLQTRLRFHQDVIREAFEKFDVDRSGFITADDLRMVLGDTFQGADVAELLKEADANEDGRIDYNEFLAAIFEEADDAQLNILTGGPVTAGLTGVSSSKSGIYNPELRAPSLINIGSSTGLQSVPEREEVSFTQERQPVVRSVVSTALPVPRAVSFSESLRYMPPKKRKELMHGLLKFVDEHMDRKDGEAAKSILSSQIQPKSDSSPTASPLSDTTSPPQQSTACSTNPSPHCADGGGAAEVDRTAARSRLNKAEESESEESDMEYQATSIMRRVQSSPGFFVVNQDGLETPLASFTKTVERTADQRAVKLESPSCTSLRYTGMKKTSKNDSAHFLPGGMLQSGGAGPKLNGDADSSSNKSIDLDETPNAPPPMGRMPPGGGRPVQPSVGRVPMGNRPTVPIGAAFPGRPRMGPGIPQRGRGQQK